MLDEKGHQLGGEVLAVEPVAPRLGREHALERRRDKLIADDGALTELRAQYPELDVQQMRTMIRNARREQAEDRPPKAYREIFQTLKQLHAGKAKAAADDAKDNAGDDGEQDDE